MKTKQFCEHIYRTRWLETQIQRVGRPLVHGDGPDEPHEAHGDNEDHQSASDHEEEPQDADDDHPPFDEEPGDDEPDAGDDPGGGGLAGGAVAPVRRAWQRGDEEIMLMRQFLASALVPHMYFSVELQKEDEPIQAFQLLSLESKPLFVSTYGDESMLEKGLFQVSVQPVEIWNAHHVLANGIPQVLEVFALSNPCMIDIISLVADDNVLDRSRWLTWEAADSDLEGCIALRNSSPLSTKCKLNDKTCPILSFLDCLREQGFESRSCKVQHKEGQDKIYDRRQLMRSRPYLQCVVSLPELNGIEFPSGQVQAFYDLLLRTRALVPLGLSAKEYKTRLAKLDGNEIRLAALDRKQPGPKRHRPAVAQPHAVAAEVASPSIAGDSDLPNVASPLASPSDSGRSSSSTSSAASSSGSSGTDIGGDADDGVEFPRQVLGQDIARLPGRKDAKWSYHERLRVQCRNPLHRKCTKSRSVNLGVADFGVQSPLYFLGAWLSKSDLPEAQHRKYVPSNEEIRAFSRNLG
jgi:hypothetical protein